MKNHHLILLSTALFLTLFYGESQVGINLGILGISYAVLILTQTPKNRRSRTFLMLFVITIFSGFAYAWFGDFPSFLAVITSGFLLAFTAQNNGLKSILVIPVFAVNFFTFIYRFFQFEEWLPKNNASGNWQRLISVFLIPAVLIGIFFAIYSLGSSHFSNLLTNFELDFNLWEFFVLGVLGFFLAFNIWNFKIYDLIWKQNHHLKNDFLNEDKIQNSSSFLDPDAERRSGVISLVALNILLLIFIVTFNYEQFVEIPKSPNQLSTETHDRVNAVILSIILAIFVLMFYFKGRFNFDQKAKSLKISAKIWIVLNAILVMSAFAKNAEYIINFGFTYKRLGVVAFLTLALIGLVLTFYKIHFKKTNAFLCNHMIWYFYGTILVCSFINWGGFITYQNLQRKNFDDDYLIYEVRFNDKQLIEYARKTKNKGLERFIKEENLRNPNNTLNQTFLSKIFYYETSKSK